MPFIILHSEFVPMQHNKQSKAEMQIHQKRVLNLLLEMFFSFSNSLEQNDIVSD